MFEIFQFFVFLVFLKHLFFKYLYPVIESFVVDYTNEKDQLKVNIKKYLAPDLLNEFKKEKKSLITFSEEVQIWIDKSLQEKELKQLQSKQMLDKYNLLRSQRLDNFKKKICLDADFTNLMQQVDLEIKNMTDVDVTKVHLDMVTLLNALQIQKE